MEFIRKVNERETAIVVLQEEQEALESTEGRVGNSTDSVPPIPEQPEVAALGDLRGITHNEEIVGSEDQQQQSHPLYLPKNKLLVDHLDKRCFHIINGRYFGLSSNAIADPYFFGPSAPGMAGLNLSASTGLATASTGGGAGSLGGPLLMIPAQPLSSSLSSSSSAPNSKASSVPSKHGFVNKTIDKSTKAAAAVAVAVAATTPVNPNKNPSPAKTFAQKITPLVN